MNLDRVSSGNDVPRDVNVIIEIPARSDPVKYEVDKKTGVLKMTQEAPEKPNF